MSKIVSGNLFTNSSYCPAKVETNICWPQTAINSALNISCGLLPESGVDSSKFVTLRCLPSGRWAPVDFSQCSYPDVWALFSRTYLERSPEDRDAFRKILEILRNIEIAGLSISTTSVVISLFIFFSFKSLRCDRTKIHINLLLAILFQIIARLTTYGIQMIRVRNSSKNVCNGNESLQSYSTTSVFDNTCSLFLILLQFGVTAMFMWMLCEGIRLNSVTTVFVFQNHFKTYYYHILGWIVPLCLTLSWSIVMIIKERGRRCFNNYMHLKYYWIIDGPRYAVIIINIIFLLNIIRIVFFKSKEDSVKQIREDNRRGSTNAKSFKKTIKAAVLLLPLLGITHVLETFISADDKSIPIFAIYGSTTVLLSALQGFFCSLFYCFLNNDVREVLSRRFQTTQIWYRWKGYLGNKGRCQDETLTTEQGTNLELKTQNGTPIKKNTVAFEEQRLTSDMDEINRN